jgi:hypothetical protein
MLLVVFGLMVLGFLCIVAWGWVQRSLAQHRSQEIVLREQIEELRRWQGERSLWETRGRWLAENPPPVWKKEDSEASFVQDLQRSVASSGIEILSQRLEESMTFPGFEEVTVQLTIRSSTEELVRWLHDIQQPGEFLAVGQLNIRVDGDKESLRAEVRLTRFYRVVDAAPAVEESEPMQETPPAEDQNLDQPLNETGAAHLSGNAADAAPTPEPDPTPAEMPSPAMEETSIVPPAPAPAPAPAPSAETPQPDVDNVTESAEPQEELQPNPVLPFDDVFDPNNPDEPIQTPAPEVFDLLPVPTPQ